MIKKIIPQPFKNIIKKNRLLKRIFLSTNLKRLSVFPSQVEIEVTSLCNARCIHCEYKDLKRPHAHMDMDLYKKIVDECSLYRKYIKELALFWIGEPLLDPTFFEKVKYAKQKGLPLVSTYCNGSLLILDNCQKLIESGLDKIVFGLDGASKETYESMRVGLSYDKVVKGIERLIDLKKKLGVSKPQVETQMVITPYNEHEQDLFKEMWRGKADYAFTRRMHVWSGQTLNKNLTKYSHQLVKEERLSSVPCFYLWKSMIIAQNGKVALCCIDSHVEEEIGNLNNQGIQEIWQGQRLNKIRELHLAGKMDKMPICQRCNFRQIKAYPWWWHNKK